MALKYFKPTTAGVRHKVGIDYSSLNKSSKIKRLIKAKKSNAGRNNQGKITVRHRGGGVKRNYRIIDFKRNKLGVSAVVETVEYDPNRSAHISLVKYADGERRYILSVDGLKVGDTIISSDTAEIKPGNCLPLAKIPSGTLVHNVELRPGDGGKLGKSAGSAILVRGSDGKGYTILKMMSGEIRLVNEKCMATVGVVSNADHVNVVIGKAGTKRLMGKRPEVRGVAMHAVQHPHGAGEARNGIRMAKDIWGHRIGRKTRRNKRTERFIISHRIAKRNAPGIQ